MNAVHSTGDNISDEEAVVEKTPLEKSRDIISQMKEMEHYARANIERLTAQWLQIDDELKQLEAVLARARSILQQTKPGKGQTKEIMMKT